MTRSSLEAFFSPRSIAIVGASDDPTKIGARPLRYLRDFGFPGQVYPVNPHRDTIQGERCFRRIEDIPGRLDHAVIAVPATEVERALEACAARGARGATVFTSGYAELGREGEVAQRRIGDLAARLGMRILGPNCQGFANVADRVYPTFSSGIERAGVESGPVAVISQSGVVSAVIYVLLRQAGAGISQWVNTGNEADLDATTVLTYVAGRDDIRVVALALETIRSGDAFAEAMAAAWAASKRVFVLKSGRTAEGAAASVSHTGAIIGRDDLCDALFRQTGATRVRTIAELVDAVALASQQDETRAGEAAGRSWQPPRLGAETGPLRLGVISNSGGTNILIADAAVPEGLRVPDASTQLKDRLGTVLPGYATPRNPLDLTGYYIAHPEALDTVAELFAASGEFDVLLVYLGIIGRLYQTDRITESFRRLRRNCPLPAVVIWQAGDETLRQQIAATGLPVMDDIDRAVHALASLARASAVPAGPGVHPPVSERAERALAIICQAKRGGQALLTPAQARELLALYEIPTPAGTVCRTPEDAAAAQRALSGPIVLKVESAAIAHKTEIGGVRLDITTPEQARRAFEEIQASLADHHPGAPFEGVRAERQIAGVEMVLGMVTDPVLGAFVTAGTGGILVEVLSDVVTRRLPLRPGEAVEMLRDVRGRVLLEGFRGSPAADRDALAAVLERWASLAADLSGELTEAEINPVIVGTGGEGAVAVDALFTLTSRGGERS